MFEELPAFHFEVAATQTSHGLLTEALSLGLCPEMCQEADPLGPTSHSTLHHTPPQALFSKFSGVKMFPSCR